MRRLLVLVLAALLALTTSVPAGRADPRPSLRLGGAPLELVGTPDSLWVLTCDRRCPGEGGRSEGRIVHIDARSGRVRAAVRVSRPHALAVGPGGVYTLDFWRGTVRRLDARTLETRGTGRLAWRGFDTSEQKTMRAVIAGAGSPYKAEVLRRLELTKDMVRKALPRLSASAEIETIDGKHAVVDPLFAEWIERINHGLPDHDTAPDDAA